MGAKLRARSFKIVMFIPLVYDKYFIVILGERKMTRKSVYKEVPERKTVFCPPSRSPTRSKRLNSAHGRCHISETSR